MARKQYEQFCLRFSMENPTHVKLFRIINNLDSDIYRSKNQFIMEALDEWRGGDNLDEDDQNDSLYRSRNRKTAD